MSDVECPYCGHDQEVCNDDGFGCSEDVVEEMQCVQCDKYFALTTSILFLYGAVKAPCMNDGEHAWRETNTTPKRCTKLRCEYCDETRPLPEGHPYLEGEDS